MLRIFTIARFIHSHRVGSASRAKNDVTTLAIHMGFERKRHDGRSFMLGHNSVPEFIAT